MENNSNGLLIKNNSLKKLNFERNSNNFYFGISRTLEIFITFSISKDIYFYIFIYNFNIWI